MIHPSGLRSMRRLGRKLLRRPEWEPVGSIDPTRMAAYRATLPDPVPALPNERDRKSLAVVIACYGHAAYLPSALSSVASQTRLPDEIVFVDDGSPDGAGAVAARFAEDAGPLGERFRLISHPRPAGQAASLNEAVEATSSALLMVLNADDILMTDCIATTLALFERHPAIAMLGAHSIHFTDESQLGPARPTIASQTRGRMPRLDIRTREDWRRYRGYNDLNMTHSGCTFRREAWRAVGGYTPDPRLRIVPFDDRDFQLRVNARYPVGVSMRVAFSFYRIGTSVARNQDDVGTPG